MNKRTEFDVVVVGAGHAGIEAAYAAARLGSKTALLTIDAAKIGMMSCNPSIGGLGKSHIVFEISAFEGVMPKLCSTSYLQARMLNTKKGAAVQGLRLQIDRYQYCRQAGTFLAGVKNLEIIEGLVVGIEFDDCKRVSGLSTQDGRHLTTRSIVLANGTFLRGVMHIGTAQTPGGRLGDPASNELSLSLIQAGLRLGRLKTGTPARLIRETIDFSKVEIQQTEPLDHLFEFESINVKNSLDCYITHTTPQTHAIIKNNVNKSAIYSGNISGRGPRYCPSIEDKIVRFPDKESHHVFIEPESLESNEMYPNGIPTSLPADVQDQFIRTIPGLENVEITRFGYAIEYDFVLPGQIGYTLESKKFEGLLLAGQINGTTGYEEAAGQGLVAGINAHASAHGTEPLILERSESYIGVMIDDIVTLGVDEPYRMFTSRAEHRLMLRQDNAFARMADKAHALGLMGDKLYNKVKSEKKAVEIILKKLGSSSAKSGQFLASLDSCKNDAERKELVTEKFGITLSPRGIKTAIAELKYAPYIEREKLEIEKLKQFQDLEIPRSFSYKGLPGLSIELQQKLEHLRPLNLAKAAMIPGITPAALSLLIFKVRGKRRHQKQITPI